MRDGPQTTQVVVVGWPGPHKGLWSPDLARNTRGGDLAIRDTSEAELERLGHHGLAAGAGITEGMGRSARCISEPQECGPRWARVPGQGEGLRRTGQQPLSLSLPLWPAPTEDRTHGTGEEGS